MDGSMNFGPDDLDGSNPSSGLLTDALDNTDVYIDRYLELSKLVARLNRLVGRRRTAARLASEQAELYMRRKEYHAAVKAMLPIYDVCAADRWERGHFWLLFRLACFQRMTQKVPAYLNTLTLCFGPHLGGVVPTKASELLQTDFEAVVAHPQVAQLRLGISSFIETDLSIEDTSGGKTSMLLNFVRKKFLKSFCTVGESVSISLGVTSYLPRSMVVDSIQVLLVPFDKYEDLFRDRQPVAETDAQEILELESSVTIEPGNNCFDFNWTPLHTGVCMLSTVLIKWKEASFFYDSAALRKPLRGIEVLPSEPTQSLEITPIFLIPGQTQPVKITFHAGSDLIDKGFVELSCSDGLSVMSPGSDSKGGTEAGAVAKRWQSSCRFLLPPCGPDGKATIETSVKSTLTAQRAHGIVGSQDISPSNGTQAIQTMQARVTTDYRHKSCKGIESTNSIPTMKTTLEALVTTLDKPAFTVGECSAYPYAEQRVMLTIGLHCNTPIPFALKEWNVQLPRMKLTDDGDFNQGLFQHPVAEGEQLTLTFNFIPDGSSSAGTPSHTAPTATLHLVLEDEDTKTFHQVLELPLQSFYTTLDKKDDLVGMNGFVADLTCASSEGLVGAPVKLRYTVDAKNVTAPKGKTGGSAAQVLYRVSPAECDWVVSGRVTGTLDLTEKRKVYHLEFVGIPIQPGVLTRFPPLSIHYESDDEQYDVDITTRYPDAFKSLSYANHMALACPANDHA